VRPPGAEGPVSSEDWQADGLRHDCTWRSTTSPSRYRALPGGVFRTTLSLAVADENLAGLGVYQQRSTAAVVR
jgi:hypothetical protein